MFTIVFVTGSYDEPAVDKEHFCRRITERRGGPEGQNVNIVRVIVTYISFLNLPLVKIKQKKKQKLPCTWRPTHYFYPMRAVREESGTETRMGSRGTFVFCTDAPGSML